MGYESDDKESGDEGDEDKGSVHYAETWEVSFVLRLSLWAILTSRCYHTQEFVKQLS